MKGFEINSLQDCITYVNSLIRGLPHIYSYLGRQSNKTVKLHIIVDQMLDKCESAIEEENRKYYDIMKERSLKNGY